MTNKPDLSQMQRSPNSLPVVERHAAASVSNRAAQRSLQGLNVQKTTTPELAQR